MLRLVDLAFQAFALHFLGYGARVKKDDDLVMVDDSSLAVIESWVWNDESLNSRPPAPLTSNSGPLNPNSSTNE